MTQRRGFTLVEVLLALVIMGLVTGAIYQLLNTNQRLSLAQAEQVSLQSNVRTGSLIVPNELRELNTVVGGVADRNDVTKADADGITYRAMRGFGFVCQTSAANEVRLSQDTWDAARTPDPSRDSLYLFWDQNVDDDDDDEWVQLAITGVSASTCGAVPAIKLSVANGPKGLVPIVPAGTPLRVFELMRLELYQDNGQWWLGAQSVSANEARQPVLGPLTKDGLQLEYYNSAGAKTAVLNAISSIRVTIQGQTDAAVRAHGTGALGHPTEVLATQVLLRNSIRP